MPVGSSGSDCELEELEDVLGAELFITELVAELLDGPTLDVELEVALDVVGQIPLPVIP